MRIDADGVLIDHTWVWRADHGVEGFTAGVNGDTDRWNTNTGRTGVVVTGDDVTATGLFVEHFQQRNLVWEGNGGTVVLFQNELPYDPPTQADWTQPDGTLGYPGYTVAANVRTHRLYGAGVYVFNQNNPVDRDGHRVLGAGSAGGAVAPRHDGEPQRGAHRARGQRHRSAGGHLNHRYAELRHRLPVTARIV